ASRSGYTKSLAAGRTATCLATAVGAPVAAAPWPAAGEAVARTPSTPAQPTIHAAMRMSARRRNDAPAEADLVAVEHGALPGRDSPLRLVEIQLEAGLPGHPQRA